MADASAAPAPISEPHRRACQAIAAQIRQWLNHLETAITHARDRGEDVAELLERRRHGLRYERAFNTRAGGPDVDYEPTPIGDAGKA